MLNRWINRKHISCFMFHDFRQRGHKWVCFSKQLDSLYNLYIKKPWWSFNNKERYSTNAWQQDPAKTCEFHHWLDISKFLQPCLHSYFRKMPDLYLIHLLANLGQDNYLLHNSFFVRKGLLTKKSWNSRLLRSQCKNLLFVTSSWTSIFYLSAIHSVCLEK